MTSFRRVLAAAAAGAVIMAATTTTGAVAPKDRCAPRRPFTRSPVPGSAQELADAVLGDMDRTVSPCSDFYRYACGGYLASNAIPRRQDKILRAVLPAINEAKAFFIAALERGGELSKSRAGDWFASCVVASRRAPKTNPLRDVVRLLAPISSASGGVTNVTVVKALARLHASGMGGDPIWSSNVKPEAVAGGVKQRLALAPPELPLTAKQAVEGGKAVAHARRQLARTMLAAACKGGFLSGCRGPKTLNAAVEAALRVETSLITAASGSDAGDVPIAAEPIFSTYFGVLPATVPGGVVLVSPAPYWLALRAHFANRTWVADLPAYLAYAVTLHAARTELLGPAPFAAWTAFTRVATPDAYAMRATVGERCYERVRLGLPDDLAPTYVRRFGTASATAQIAAILADMQVGVAAMLKATPWLDEPSTTEALAKLAATTFHIGADPVYDAYTDVVIRRGGATAYAANVASVAASAWRRRVAPLTSPAAAARWELPAYRPNARNRAAGNLITISTAMGQYPLLAPDAPYVPVALTYGAAGFIAAHEVGHSYDTGGINFDAAGANREWLSNASMAAAVERAACVVGQYSGYRITELDAAGPPVFANGAMTLNENIADAVGLRVSHERLRSALAGRLASRSLAATNPPLAAVFTDEQLFFVGAAQLWCEKRTESGMRTYLANDFHAIGRLRVLGPMSHSPAFAAAFQCPRGSVYRPEERCKLYGE